MKKYFCLFFIAPYILSAQQPVLITGEKQGMRFTDVIPDVAVGCNYYGTYGCSGKFRFDLDNSGYDDVFFLYSSTECRSYYSSQELTVHIMSDISILMDTSNSGLWGTPPYFINDSVFADNNSKPDFHITGTQDTLPPYSTHWDTTYFTNRYAWVDSFDYYGGHGGFHLSWWGSCFSSGFGWVEQPDTNLYVVFRKILPNDTLYGWIEAYQQYGMITIHSFAMTGDTGSYIYSATEKISEDPDIKLYPNPATNTVTISIVETMVGSTATITDVTGRKMTAVFLSTVNRQLSTADFANGVYFVTVTDKEGRSATKKLIINHP